MTQLPGAFVESKSASAIKNLGFGGREARDAKILGQSSDAPGPGAYLDDDPFFA